MTSQSRNRQHRTPQRRRKIEGWEKGRSVSWDSLSPSRRREILDDPSFVYITEDGEHLSGEDALRLWRRACDEKWPLYERKPILRSMNTSDRKRILKEMNLIQVWRCSDNRIFKIQATIVGWILLIVILAFVFG